MTYALCVLITWKLSPTSAIIALALYPYLTFVIFVNGKFVGAVFSNLIIKLNVQFFHKIHDFCLQQISETATSLELVIATLLSFEKRTWHIQYPLAGDII